MHIAQQLKNHIRIVIIILFIVLVGIIALIIKLNTPPEPEVEIPEPTPTNELRYVKIEEVVNTAAQSDTGIDISSDIVQESIKQIDNASTLLPYTKEVQLSDGRTIEIVIPSMALTDNEWTLLVQLFGIDYEIPADSPEYETEKQAFLEGVSHVKQFFTEHNIDSSKIIIIWGDRALVHDRAQMWLEQ